MPESRQPNQFTFDLNTGNGGSWSNNLSDANFGPAPQQLRAGFSLMDELMSGVTDSFSDLVSAPQPTVDWAALVQQVATFGEDQIFDDPSFDAFPPLEPPSNAPADASPLEPLMVDEFCSDKADMQGVNVPANLQISALDDAPFTMPAPFGGVITQRPRLTADAKAQRKVNARVNALRNKELDDSIREFEALKMQQVDALSIKHAVPITRINKLMGSGQVLKGTRSPNVHNAMTSRAFSHFNHGEHLFTGPTIYHLLMCDRNRTSPR